MTGLLLMIRHKLSTDAYLRNRRTQQASSDQQASSEALPPLGANEQYLRPGSANNDQPEMREPKR